MIQSITISDCVGPYSQCVLKGDILQCIDHAKRLCYEGVEMHMRNAKLIHDELTKAGFSVSGGVNAPYIWLETPDKMTSWEFFDYLLNNAQVVGTPGAGFGKNGQNFFRLTSFGTHESTKEAMARFEKLF